METLRQRDLLVRALTGEAKSKLKAKLDAAQDRLQARRDLLKENIEAIKREGEAKIKSLHQLRVDELSKAWQLIKLAAAI